MAREVSIGLPAEPLPRTSRIAQILGGGKSVDVQWLHGVPVTVEQPELVAQTLDGILRDSVRDGG